jgi:hypothetical protein
MALNRVTSLEECEHRESMFSRPRQGESDETASLDDAQASRNPKPDRSSSPSRATQHSLGPRLSFNPAAGPSWNQREIDGEWSYLQEERVSLSADGSEGDDESVYVVGGPIPRPDTAFQEPAAGFGQATGAFEVSKGKRIGELSQVV